MRNYKPTKILLYQGCKRIIEEMRIPRGNNEGNLNNGDCYGRCFGPVDKREIEGANDILYRLLCTEGIAFMAKKSGTSKQKLYDAIDMWLSLTAKEIEGLNTVHPATNPSNVSRPHSPL
jgi:hypothetical protein